MATLTTVRLNKNDAPSWGFRLQGGKDFGTPLVIQKVNGGSPAERAGLIAGDAVIKINNTDVFNLTHKDAQDVILRAGNSFDMSITRGGSTWKPSIIPTGKIPKPTPAINNVSPVTKTSLAAKPTENIGAIGTGHNNAAKPFGVTNGGLQPVKYNCPIKLYSEDALAETIAAQTEVLQGGALGVNFKKNEKDYDVTNSAVYRMLKEAENDTGGYNHHDVKHEINQNQKKEDSKAEDCEPDSGIVTAPNRGIAGLKHVEAPVAKPPAPAPQIPPGQNICADCERLIVGVFVRIKDKNLHVECFKCSTCGSSLKNVGYYNINHKLYCDVHAKSAALSSNNAPAPGLVPVTLSPGGRAPAGAISAALSSHPLPSSGPLSPPYQPLADVTNGPSPVHSAPTANFNALKISESTTNTSKLQTINNNSHSPLYNSSTPLSFSKYINKSQSNLSAARPFSSVSAPLSPGGTFPRAAPLSPPKAAPLSPPVNHFNKAPLSPPTHQPYSPVSSVGRAPSFKNTSGGLFKEPVTWPPPKAEEEETAPTACPLFYPPPSQIEAEIRLKQAAKQSKREEDNDFYEEENLELRKINSMDETSSYYSDTLSLSGRKSTTECVEIVSEHLDTQQMVERMKRLTPQLVPQPLELEDIELLRQQKNTSNCRKDNDEKLVEPIIPDTTPDQRENKIDLPVPKKWESTLTQAARTESPAPDTFAQLPSTVIPNYRPVSPFVNALSTAPTEPFTSVSNNAPEDVPLPEFTEPYIPPYHPVIHEKTDDELAQEKAKKFKEDPPLPMSPFTKALEIAPDRPFTPVGGIPSIPKPIIKKKPKDPLDKILDELRKSAEKLDMRTALTYAPDRAYTPIVGEEEEKKVPPTKSKYSSDSENLNKSLKPEELPPSFKRNVKEPKPPSYYPPSAIQEFIETGEKVEKEEKTETKTIEKHTFETIPGSQQQTVVVTNPHEPQVVSNFAPFFQGFSCSFQNKSDYSQFSVEVSTTPPVPTPPPKPITPVAYVATVEQKPTSYIQQTERIVQESKTHQESSLRQEMQMQVCQESQRRPEILEGSQIRTVTAPISKAPESNKECPLKQKEDVVRITPTNTTVLLKRPEKMPQYQQDIQAAAESDLLLLKRKEESRARMQQQKKLEQSSTQEISQLSSTTQQQCMENVTTPELRNQPEQSKQNVCQKPPESKKVPIITIAPDNNNQPPKVNFNSVENNKLRRVSPHRSIAPSMVHNAPPLLPYYQEDLVHHYHAAVKTNILDPKSPDISRSPTPNIMKMRAQSPAFRRSPAPESVQKVQKPQRSATPEQIQKAKETFQSSVCERQNQAQSCSMKQQQTRQTSAQSEAGQIFQTPCGSQVCDKPCTQGQVCDRPCAQGNICERPCAQGMRNVISDPMQWGQQTFAASAEEKHHSYDEKFASGAVTRTDISQKDLKAELQEQNVSQTQECEKSADGLVQIQRKKTVTEEYEHVHKEKTVEIQKNTTRYAFNKINEASIEETKTPMVQGMHVTNPGHIESPFKRMVQAIQQDPSQLDQKCDKLKAQAIEIKPLPTTKFIEVRRDSGVSMLPVPPPTPTGMQSYSTPVSVPQESSFNLPSSSPQCPLPPTSSGPQCSFNKSTDPKNSTKHVSPPRDKSSQSVPKSDVGAGSGRQAGGVSVAPKKGRGVLNTAVLAGRIPLCGQCHGQIRGPFITALGKIWCPHHFACATPSCKRPLQDLGFVEEKGQLYCEFCFEQYLAPPCSKCGGKVKGDCLKAIGKNFHPECFNCSYCGKLFGNSPFFLEDGSPYCDADWNELFTTKCFACGFPIEAGDRWVEALSNNYHSLCFNCTMCKKNLEGQSFFAKGGRPYCKTHAR